MEPKYMMNALLIWYHLQGRYIMCLSMAHGAYSLVVIDIWPVTQRSLVQIPLWVLHAVYYVHIYIDPVSSPSCVWIPEQEVGATLQWSGSTIQRES